MQHIDLARVYDLCNLLGVAVAVSHDLKTDDLTLTINPEGRSELDIMLILPGNRVRWYDMDWKQQHFEPIRSAS